MANNPANPAGAVAAANGADYVAIANANAANLRMLSITTTNQKRISPSGWLDTERKSVMHLATPLTRTPNWRLKMRSISGKLMSGPALDAYNRLPAATKLDYTLLKTALLDEFVDPQEKTRFQEDFSYNKRKKDQSLKEFMQEIIKDQGLYSDMCDTIGIGAAAVPNQERIRDGIRRFKRGIRNREGRKDSDQISHLRYNLLKDADLTWENALDIASRWEAANDLGENSPSSSSSLEDGDSLDALECHTGKKEAKTFKKSRKVTKCAIEGDGAMGAVAALAEDVKMNASNIKELKSVQKGLTATVTAWRDETNDTLRQILETLQMGEASQDQKE